MRQRQRLTTPVCSVLAMTALVGCQATGDLGGTRWTVVEVLATHRPDVTNLDVTFGTDGWVTSAITTMDGQVETKRHPYAVHDALLVVREADGDLNILHTITGDEMLLTAESFQARFQRLD